MSQFDRDAIPYLACADLSDELPGTNNFAGDVDNCLIAGTASNPYTDAREEPNVGKSITECVVNINVTAFVYHDVFEAPADPKMRDIKKSGIDVFTAGLERQRGAQSMNRHCERICFEKMYDIPNTRLRNDVSRIFQMCLVEGDEDATNLAKDRAMVPASSLGTALDAELKSAGLSPALAGSKAVGTSSAAILPLDLKPHLI